MAKKTPFEVLIGHEAILVSTDNQHMFWFIYLFYKKEKSNDHNITLSVKSSIKLNTFGFLLRIFTIQTQTNLQMTEQTISKDKVENNSATVLWEVGHIAL